MKGYEYYVGYDLQEYGGRDEVLLIATSPRETHAFFGQVRTDDDWSDESAPVRRPALQLAH